MHEELETAERAEARLTHDILVHLVREPGWLRTVRVAIRPDWDAAAFAEGMAARLAARGNDDVAVVVLTTDGDPRLLSVVLDR